VHDALLRAVLKSSANALKVQLRDAGQIATNAVDETTLRVYDHRDQLIKHVSRTSRKEVHRYEPTVTHHQVGNRLGTVTHHLKLT
jgi:hypothetical protein